MEGHLARILFDGPEGQLEGLLELKESSRGVVLCHPHPLYGGSMDDMVLEVLCKAFADHECSTLRFNFRGVGSSQGKHDKGEGEVGDVIAAVTYLRDQGSSKIVLAGYSFGAAMCLKAEHLVNPDAMLLVAPPIQIIEDFAEPRAPCLVLLGRDDQIVEAESTVDYFPNSRIELIEGADHFFFGAHGQIESLVLEKGPDLWN